MHRDEWRPIPGSRYLEDSRGDRFGWSVQLGIGGRDQVGRGCCSREREEQGIAKDRVKRSQEGTEKGRGRVKKRLNRCDGTSVPGGKKR